jgi:DNA-binding transcriptional MocR family regulator
MHANCPWTARVWQEFRAGNLTRSARDILLTLRTYRGPGGLICPSHATLADRAKCSVRSVQRALQQADHLGLVRWAERRVRAAWRWLRTSNRYWLTTPESPVTAGLKQRRPKPVRPVDSTTGQLARGGESSSKKEALRALLAEAARMPDLLAMRRQAMAQQLVRSL